MGAEEAIMEETAAPLSSSTTQKTPTVHFVLVHGINGGSWCWYKIRCLMENSGYRVTCIDLKSAGIDPADANSVHSFDDYNKPLMEFMSSLPDNEQVLNYYQSFRTCFMHTCIFYDCPFYVYKLQVILVGHSAGGLSVTQATHKFAKKIKLAVYVAATMLKFGFWTDQDIQHVNSFSYYISFFLIFSSSFFSLINFTEFIY